MNSSSSEKSVSLPPVASSGSIFCYRLFERGRKKVLLSCRRLWRPGGGGIFVPLEARVVRKYHSSTVVHTIGYSANQRTCEKQCCISSKRKEIQKIYNTPSTSKIMFAWLSSCNFRQFSKLCSMFSSEGPRFFQNNFP